MVGAAGLAYLAFLQLQYSSQGHADAADVQNLAIWNGIAAGITAYFGAVLIVRPTPQRLMGSAIWAILNVGWGAIQVSQGVTHPAYLISLVAFGAAGVLSFVSWQQTPRSGPTFSPVARVLLALIAVGAAAALFLYLSQ